MRRLSPLFAALLGGGAAAACLPNDTRTAPGSVLVSVESDGVAASGIPASATSDGWAIAFDQVLIALGNVSLDGDSCDVYSDSGYNRIFDMKVDGEQKVTIVYALGHCDFGFRVSSPNDDTVLGRGVSEAEKTMMRTPGSDNRTTNSGTSMYVSGHATSADVTKTFAWAFRFRARYDRCTSSPFASGSGSVSDTGVDLASKVSRAIVLGVSPGALFSNELDLRGNPAPVAPPRPRFQVFADADTLTGDDDGVVTLDELARVPATRAGFVDLDGPGDGGLPLIDAAAVPSSDAGALSIIDETVEGGLEPTLEDYLYMVLFPAMIRYGNGSCSVRLTNRGVTN
ncbi:MAG TPA: hypothetical protein VHU80_06655 [Polyangiaceae bacterium]|nr:hypothetical protein [Polyangiaceae bacterium]